MIATAQNWKPLRYHREHARLWTYNGRFAAIRAGRQSGKTEIFARKLISLLPQKMWHGQPGNFAYIAPTVPQAKRIIWERLKRYAKTYADCIANINESELFIESIWGSRIYVCGFDKPERIEGTPWDFVIVDESSDIKPKAVDKSILPALIQTKGKLWRGGVPKRVGVGAIEFGKICDDRALGYEYFYWSAEDLMDSDEIAVQKSRLAKKDYDEQVRGLAVAVGGSAFHGFTVEGNVVASPLTQYNPNRIIIVGSDFNVNPMAWCLCHIVDNKLCVFDEVWLLNTNTRATLDVLWSRYSDHKAGFNFIGDAAGRQRRSVATTASPSDYALIKNDARFANSYGGVNVNYPLSNPRIKDRLASCNALLCNANDERRVLIAPQCQHLIDDLSVRSMDDNGDPVKSGDEYGHMSDAFGYVVHTLFPVYINTDETIERTGSAVQLTVVG